MDTRILVPTDGSDSARAALEHALDIAADRDAVVHVLNVADTNQPSLTRLGTQVVDALEEEGEEIVSAAAELAAERDVAVSTHVVQGEPRETIVEFVTAGAESESESDDADGVAFDFVVMGAHGRRGLGEYILGSVTDYVVNRSEVPVLTVRAADDARATYPYGDVLVPTDGSVHARAAVELGAQFANRCGGTLHLLSVMDELPEVADAETAPLPAQLEENLREALEEDAATAARAGADDVETAIETGSVPREVLAYAEAEAIDLVVMGTHGRTGIDRHLLGSFTERVIRTSPVPVLTTRRAEEMD
ncbi:universal stress protein [Haloterrigena sp. SYSU A558-1]|uniref:Universal stress protein n=1 Tax=Haloterrigena gelatinilytica TaxID=2741724 RepID=A0A8J8GL85_9EURY|nr:universal stress protein [Haloterrigena gelatinilytica]NUB89837.1 universal stress protein [Haloterrigena gelatinilytica]NUC74332.1 universal stress protein [Haloterrigena gelatinilytica]